MTRIKAAWLEHPGARSVMEALTSGGQQALYVGGCVRNTLMGLPAMDVDIATDADPLRVQILARGAGMKTIPTGIDHGTITLVSHGESYEVTTFRRDVTTDGRNATVTFSTDVREDAARRDFTMNALYADKNGEVIDPLNGLEDLKARKIRFIGDADERIREDYLRILRFFRFSALYGHPYEFTIDPDGLRACRNGRDGLSIVSPERVGMEMRKILGAPSPFRVMPEMQACGVLEKILPGARGGQFWHISLVEHEAGLKPDWIRRLAFCCSGDVTDRLRLTRTEARTLSALQEGMRQDQSAGETGYRFGEAATDILALRAVRSGSKLTAGEINEALEGSRKTLPVQAADLMPELKGKALGEKLREMETRWIASGFSLDRDSLLFEDETPTP